MFKFLFSIIIIFPLAWAQQMPKVTMSSIDTGYIPFGFDSNDNVQLAIEGTYRDTCSKSAGTRHVVNPATKTIQIYSYEYKYGGPCLDILVPHNEVVNLGILATGTYTVSQAGGHFLGKLNVNTARSNSADDFLYAPISQAYIKNVGGRLTLTLSGTFSNSCMRIEKVISHVQNNVVTVQPLALLLPTYTHCIHGSFPFEHTSVIESAKTGRYLLHVRSLNGNSINNIFDLK